MGRKVKMVSLDTSTTSTGWAYYENGVLTESGVLDHTKEKDTVIRMEDMILDIFNNVLNKFKPLIVVIERPPMVKDAETLTNLAEIVGCVKGWSLCHYAEFVELRPTAWRKYVAEGDDKAPKHRKEAKPWDIKRVRELFGIETKNDDLADAILIGQARINQMHEEKKKNQEEREERTA